MIFNEHYLPLESETEGFTDMSTHTIKLRLCEKDNKLMSVTLIEDKYYEKPLKVLKHDIETTKKALEQYTIDGFGQSHKRSCNDVECYESIIDKKVKDNSIKADQYSFSFTYNFCNTLVIIESSRNKTGKREDKGIQ